MLFHSLSQTQTVLALSVFFLTFAYEDGATLLAATLSASGKLDSRLALLSAAAGIWIGDLGLYFLGARLAGSIASSRLIARFVPSHALDSARQWFHARGLWAIVISRLVPGSRLPLYIAAGAFGVPARRFASITAVCCAAWVSFIFGLWHLAPGASSPMGSKTPWIAALALLAGPWLLGTLGIHVRRVIRKSSPEICPG